MKRSLLLLMIVPIIGFGQGLYTLERDDIGDITQLSLEDHIQITAVGSSDILTLKRLVINNEYLITTATLEISLDICESFQDITTIEDVGDYFVTISFFDQDTSCVLAASLVSYGSFTLAGTPPLNLQASKLSKFKMENGCVNLFGTTKLAVHHALFYKPNSLGSEAGGIFPIKYFSINILHLGAG